MQGLSNGWFNGCNPVDLLELNKVRVVSFACTEKRLIRSYLTLLSSLDFVEH